MQRPAGRAQYQHQSRRSTRAIRPTAAQLARPLPAVDLAPGGSATPPQAPEQAEGTTGLRESLEAIMVFFVRDFEMMITYLGQPRVPRTNNHAERENRRYRAVAQP